MQFRVPQFIDVEDKIFGPFTFKQFLYLAGGGGLAFLSWKLLPVIIALPLAFIFAGLGLALAFYKINDRPFIFFLQSYIAYTFSNKLYIWKQPEKKKMDGVKKEDVKNTEETQNKTMDKTKIQDLAWSLDVLDMNNHGK